MSVVGIVLDGVAPLVGGGAAGAAISWARTKQSCDANRRGRARLVHEDLLRLQSTIARLARQKGGHNTWGEDSWLGVPLAETEAQQDVLEYLSEWQFSACASALGWAAYIRRGYNCAVFPSDDELEGAYRRLAGGRAALAGLAGIPYRRHDAQRLVPEATRPGALTLPVLGEIEARREAEARYDEGISKDGPQRSRRGPLGLLDITGMRS